MRLELLPKPTPEVCEYLERARAYAETVLAPTAHDDDEQSHFRRDAFNRAVQDHLTAISLPKKWGGRGASSAAYYSVLEEISRVSPSMAIVIGVTNLIQGGLAGFGTADQQERFLKPLISGEYLGAFSLSEPGSGSDAAGLRTTAKRVAGGYSITGTKLWCSSAGAADLYLLIARTSPDRTRGISAFLVPKDTPGFRVGKLEKKLGLRASTLAELIFEDAFLPEANRLGAEGEGFKVALSQLDAGRISIGVVGLGIAAAAIEACWTGAPELPQGDKEILAGHFAQLCSTRALAHLAYAERDAGRRFTMAASQVKLLGSDLAVHAASDAITFLGPTGYRRETGVERMLRDAKALQIVEGTNQIQKLVLTREMENQLS